MNCRIYKCVKDGKTSFRITKQLLDSTYVKARAVKKKGEIVITFPCDEKYNYILNCAITKKKK